ncbi:unnamed protein product [marine sediment metagenome]|uniref:Uncharacterized protein n=1 Tax=marine sediment metagenome TaxID=412755 RepID=X1IE61_9ZZZZ
MAAILPIIMGIANVMEIVTFIQFIEEEAIQSAALGVFLAIRGKSYRGALGQSNLLPLRRLGMERSPVGPG